MSGINAECIGVVGKTAIYPVKGMASGTEVNETSWSSISAAGDRVKGLFKPSLRKPFAWMSSEDHPDLLKFTGYLEDPSRPKDSPVRVITPNGKDWSIYDPRLIAQLSRMAGQPVIPFSMGRGDYHSMPAAVILDKTIDWVGQQMGLPDGERLDWRRFRPNVLIEAAAQVPALAEDNMHGCFLQFGEKPDGAVLWVLKDDKRCKTVNVDPTTFQYDRRVLDTINVHHKGMLGSYCSLVREGKIRVGDPVFLRPGPDFSA